MTTPSHTSEKLTLDLLEEGKTGFAVFPSSIAGAWREWAGRIIQGNPKADFLE
jgi:hypothetical protein